LLIHELLI